MNFKEEILRILLKIYYYPKIRFEVVYEDFNPNRLDSYILIGNHQSAHDGMMGSIMLLKPPIPIMNTFVLTNRFTKFLFTKVYMSIGKRKGQPDIVTVKKMMTALKGNRGIYLFPEGNASFFGMQSDIPTSTFKFIKKMKKDVVMCEIRGAYMTIPRWADKFTRKGLIRYRFYTLFKGEDLEELTTEEIDNKIRKAIEFNEFDWNRERKHLYKPKKRALGLERYIYFCPKCKQFQTIYTKGNKIFCMNCGEIGHFDEYSMISGMDFDNLIEWDQLQKSKLPKIINECLHTCGKMYEKDTINLKSKTLGKVDIELIDNVLCIQHRHKEYSFTLDIMKDLALTRKDEVSFDYEDKTYFIKMQDPMLFYDAIQFKNGG